MSDTPVIVEGGAVPVVAPFQTPAEMLPRVLRSMFWMLNSNALGRIFNLARGIILAHLLVPGDFGLFGLASIVIGFSIMFSDVGAGAFLVYSQDDVQKHFGTAFWTNLGIATILSLGVLASAPFVAHFYRRPELIPILCVLAAALWLQSASTVHRNLLRRNLRFRTLAVVDTLANLAMFGAAVVLAWRGFGVWSFVWSTFLSNMFSLMLLLFAYHRFPHWEFSWASFRVLAPFSGWYVGQAVAWYLLLNIDNLMVGKSLGMNSLGLYGVAYNYALLPVTFIAGAMGSVMFAELPRLYSDPPRFWAAYFQLSRLTAGLALPVAAVAALVAPDLFPILFGAKWNAAIVPFQIIAAYGAIRCLWADPFASLGRFDLSFWTGLAACIASALAIYMALPHGIVGVAWAVLSVGLATQVAALWMATKSLARMQEALTNTLQPLLVAGLAVILALGVRQLCWIWFGDARLARAAVSGSSVLIIYGSILHRSLRQLLSIGFQGNRKRPNAQNAS